MASTYRELIFGYRIKYGSKKWQICYGTINTLEEETLWFIVPTIKGNKEGFKTKKEAKIALLLHII